MSRCDKCKKRFTCKRSKYYKDLDGEKESDFKKVLPAVRFLSLRLLSSPKSKSYEVI